MEEQVQSILKELEIEENTLVRFLVINTTYSEVEIKSEQQWGRFYMRNHWRTNKTGVEREVDGHEHIEYEDTYSAIYSCRLCDNTYEFYEWINTEYHNRNRPYDQIEEMPKSKPLLIDIEDFLEVYEHNERYREHMNEHLKLAMWIERNPFNLAFTNASISFSIDYFNDGYFRDNSLYVKNFEYIGDINKLFTMHKLFADSTNTVYRYTDMKLIELLIQVEEMY